MNSMTRPSFWRAYSGLSPEIKARARIAYRQFLLNPLHPSLHFKKLAGHENVWSVRVSEQYRAVGVRSGDMIEWIWIGSHNDFDKRFS
jgi:hypothetical protein